MSLSIKKFVYDFLAESLFLKKDEERGKLIVFSDLPDARQASSETFKNKATLKNANFNWDTEVNAWTIDMSSFEDAKKTLTAINKKEYFIDKIEDIEKFINNSDVPNKNQLSDRIKLFVDDLANATDEAAADAKIKQYLNFFSKFRKHSFTNSFLIFIQRPEATQVAGFRQWEEKFGRKVKKGAKGIMIYAPLIKKVEGGAEAGNLDKEVQDKVVKGFKAVYVFDIADTEVIDPEKGAIPEEPKWFGENTPSETAEKLFRYATIAANDMGINVSHEEAKGEERGFSRGDHINLSSNVEGVGKLSTMIHEWAHELMHWKKSSPFYDVKNMEVNNSRELKELQAESVSYTVLRHYDIPVSHHATYLALWKANKDKIKENIEIIVKVSKFIIDKIDAIAANDKGQANPAPAPGGEQPPLQNVAENGIDFSGEDDDPPVILVVGKKRFNLNEPIGVNHPVFKLVETKFFEWAKHNERLWSELYDGDEAPFSQKGAVLQAIEYIQEYIQNEKNGIATWQDAEKFSDYISAFTGS